MFPKSYSPQSDHGDKLGNDVFTDIISHCSLNFFVITEMKILFTVLPTHQHFFMNTNCGQNGDVEETNMEQ